MHWTTERVGVRLRARRPRSAGLARTLADALLLHRLREILRAFPQRVERLPLRIDRAVGTAATERTLGILHGVAGTAKLIGAVVLVGILTQTVLAQLLHQLVKLIAQRL